jgi:hypothetical protein
MDVPFIGVGVCVFERGVCIDVEVPAVGVFKRGD